MRNIVGYANILNSGNDAIYKTNMRGQQKNNGETGELAYIYIAGSFVARNKTN